MNLEPTAATLPLVGGVLALDFVNTAAGRGGREAFDHLATPDDLIAWSRHAGVRGGETARHGEASAEADDGAALLRRAVSLREAIYRVGVALAGHSQPQGADLALIKDSGRRALAAADFAPTPSGGYAFDFSHGPTEAAILGPVAWSAIDLLGSTSIDRIKQCPGDNCGWLFLDVSKNGSRRWCSMATCGNRLKGRRHRERR